MTDSLIKTENLVLTWIRLPKGSENETGAEVVLEFKDTDTGAIVKVYAQKSKADKYAWVPEDQENYPDDVHRLLMNSMDVVDTWAHHTLKYVKEKYL